MGLTVIGAGFGLAPAVVLLLAGCLTPPPASRPAPPPAPYVPQSPPVPIGALTTRPQPLDTTAAPSEYPEEARVAGFEGSVLLRILIDETGRVSDAVVVQDPGHGLGEAAARMAIAHFRFKPARLHDRPVATWWTFTVTYELPRQ